MKARKIDPRFVYGRTTMPDPDGRCGACGWANFEYCNGHIFGHDGTRGYGCANRACRAVKPENWREIRANGGE